VLLDGVGGEIGTAAAGLLDGGGRLVRFGQASGEPADTADAAARGVVVSWGIGPALAGRPGGLRELQQRALADAASGRWTAALQPFPLAAAAQAHAALESRSTTGKVVLLP
jgi:NADPH2:quinone reductase